MCGCLGNRYISQAVKDVRATQETLADLFDRMKYFFMRLETYIAVRPTAAMTEIIVQIMVEVISILGIVTKEIGQGRFSMPFLVDILSRFDILMQRNMSRSCLEYIVFRTRFNGWTN